MDSFTYIDLFAGAGGLSEGFYQAGFEPLAHVEMDEHACMTLRTRLAWYYLEKASARQVYYRYLRGDISRDHLYASVPAEYVDSVINAEVSDETFDGIVRRIDRLTQTRKVDLIIGGPPCQAYSIAGRGRLGREVMEQDSRSQLYIQYIKFLERYQPRMFVFENVLGLLTFRDGNMLSEMREAFAQAGYAMEVNIWNAADYDVLQDRRRLIIVGWQLGSKEYGYPSQSIVSRAVSFRVRQVLDDLPSLRPGEGSILNGEYRSGCANSDHSPYMLKTGLKRFSKVLTWHVARPHRSEDQEIYRIAIDKWERGERLKYSDLPPHLKFHKNESSFIDRFKVVGYNEKAAQTVVAHINKDGHYYIHPDKHQCRSLTVREAARLQSFPDNYFFEGARTSAYKQIGNAVPPLLALAIARRIKLILDGQKAFEKNTLPIKPLGVNQLDLEL